MNHGLSMNRVGVINNAWQGPTKRVVTLCSAGCLRSPTAAHVLASPPFNLNTRCAGLTEKYAIVRFSAALAAWADEIIVMEPHQRDKVLYLTKGWFGEDTYYFDPKETPIIVLEIPDNFGYRDPDLVRMIKERYTAYQETANG